MIRLAHFSDVHLTTPELGWRIRDLLGKRATGWVNVRFLGRGNRFKHADRVVEALIREFRERPFDHLVFSGDATTMAFDAEMDAAARRLCVGDESLPPVFGVPGNHDLYTAGAFHRQTFEKAFAPWQGGERVDDHVYPFARKVGHVWLVGLNSSIPNFWPWDARGKVGEPQLERLRRLVVRLDPGPRVFISHYPLLTKHRRPEAKWHRLTDWRHVRDAAAECGAHLWLNGHKHHWYVLGAGEDLPFPMVCVGSSAQVKLWGYHEYTIDGWHLKALRREYDPESGRFADVETFELDLAPPAGR